MLDDYELDQAVKLALLDVMIVLFDHGITEINMGGIMRVLGVPNETAQEYDENIMVLTDDFAKYVDNLTKLVDDETTNKNNRTLH